MALEGALGGVRSGCPNLHISCHILRGACTNPCETAKGVDNRTRARHPAPLAMTDRPDPYRSVARELLCVLAAEGRPMSLRELQEPGRLADDDAAFQLSVARVAGFVRTVPGGEPAPVRSPREPCYQPTTLGWMIARRTTRAGALARQLRAADDAPWAPERRRAAPR
jgi:hypothetical protein